MSNKPNEPLFNDAKVLLSKIMNHLDYVRICTLEFFDANGTLYANESAPWVHNSGYWVIEGAVTS